MAEPLKLVQPDPKQDVIQLLEERLAQAKAGHIHAITVLSFYKMEDTSFGIATAGLQEDVQALGAIELFKSGFLKHVWGDT